MLFMTTIGTTRSSVAYLIEVLASMARELDAKITVRPALLPDRAAADKVRPASASPRAARAAASGANSRADYGAPDQRRLKRVSE